MPFTAKELIDDLLQRVRDPDGLMHSRVFVRTIILSNVQRMVNAKHHNILDTSTLTVNKRQQMYSISSLLPTAIFVDAVRDGTRNIDFVRWRELTHGDPNWFRAVGSRILNYSLVGRDLLVLHPGVDSPSSVTVVFTKFLDDFADETSLTEVVDDLVPEIVSLSEAVLLVRAKYLVQARSLTGAGAQSGQG